MIHTRPAVFLDRDGVVIEDVHYLNAPEQVRLIPGSAEAIAALNRAGWPVVIVTNQSGVARGVIPFGALAGVHQHLMELLRGYGARVDGVYFCPHHPAGELEEFRVECACRKPQPGLLLQAASALGPDLNGSWMVGDRLSDLEAGAAAGCRTILVRTGLGSGIDPALLDRQTLRLELIAANLGDAVAKLRLAAARPAA